MSETVQTILSQFDRSIIFLVWPSVQAYNKDKDQWQRVLYNKHKGVNSIHHLDSERAVIAYSYRSESEWAFYIG